MEQLLAVVTPWYKQSLMSFVILSFCFEVHRRFLRIIRSKDSRFPTKSPYPASFPKVSFWEANQLTWRSHAMSWYLPKHSDNQWQVQIGIVTAKVLFSWCNSFFLLGYYKISVMSFDLNWRNIAVLIWLNPVQKSVSFFWKPSCREDFVCKKPFDMLNSRNWFKSSNSTMTEVQFCQIFHKFFLGLEDLGILSGSIYLFQTRFCWIMCLHFHHYNNKRFKFSGRLQETKSKAILQLFE